MPLFNPKALEAALQAFDFTPSDAQQGAASHWAKLMRDEFLLSQKETALEADFNRYIVQDVLGYRSFDTSGTATVSVKQVVGPGEVDLALGHFSADRTDILAPFELKALRSKIWMQSCLGALRRLCNKRGNTPTTL
jgi:hypothetical protein